MQDNVKRLIDDARKLCEAGYWPLAMSVLATLLPEQQAVPWESLRDDLVELGAKPKSERLRQTEGCK